MLMVYLIWLIWFLNLFMNLIILLNFLIAIISQSYDRVISNRLTYQYKHKSELNCERLQMLDFLKPFLKRFIEFECFDLMCIVSSHSDDLDKYQITTGLTYKMKILMKKHTNKISEDMRNHFINN